MNTFDTILEQAQKLSSSEREAFLERACKGDVDLKRRLREQLDLAEKAAAFFGEKDTSQENGETICEARAFEGPGAVIGRYKLREKIGEGGCGVVYVAEQEEPVRRRVALKVIKLGMDTRSIIARFEAERQALAMMDHPNIAKVLDGGSTETGRPYFVMELVRGIKITEYCDQNNLSTRERLDLFAKVCGAVQHAHQKGIIHRDLKPSNILVTLHDGVPVPKVIDFGIAKATEGRLTDKTVYTELHQFIGTPAYMSPEQAEMSGLDIDTRSDIYSLGVLLYELLTGKTPFEAKDLLEAGLDAMRRTIREVEPSRPSTRLSTMQAGDLTTTAKRRSVDSPKLVNLIRGDLDWIVMKSLEKDRTRRYETANSFAADIQRHLNNELVLARPPSAIYKLQKSVRRNRLAYTAAAAVACALIAGAIISSLQASRAKRAEALAKARLAEVAAERDAKEQARKDAEEVSKFLQEVFQSPDPSRDGRTITVAETLDRAIARLETDLKDQPGRRAQLQATLARTYSALGLPRVAIPIQEKVREYWLHKVGAGQEETVTMMQDLGGSYYEAGRRDEALKIREETVALSRELRGPEDPRTIMALTDLMVSYWDHGTTNLLPLAEETVALSRRINGPEHAVTIRALHYLANSYDKSARRDEQLKLREEVLRLRRKVDGPEHPETITAMGNLGASYLNTGRHDDSLKLAEDVLALRRKVQGPEHPHTIFAMANVALSYSKTGRNDEALKLQGEILDLSRRVNGPEHPETISAMYNLARSYADAGRRDEVLKLCEDVVTLCRKAHGLEHRDTILAIRSLAKAYADAERWGEALKLREQALALSRKVNGPDHADTIWLVNNLAASYADAGRREEALKLREEAATLCRKAHGLEHRDTILALGYLANAYADAERWGEALKLREQALALSRKVNGPDHADTIWLVNNLAGSYADAGRREEALKLREETVEIQQKRHGRGHPETIQAMENLASAQVSAGRRDQALKIWEEALAAGREKPGVEHAVVLRVMDNLGAAQGGPRGAKLLQETLEISRKVNGDKHPFTAEVFGDLITVHGGLDLTDRSSSQNGEAFGRIQKLIEWALPILGTNDIWIFAAMHKLGGLYLQAGKTNIGREILTRITREGIKDWLILAPISSHGENGAVSLGGKQLSGEADIHPRDGDHAVCGGKELTWRAYHGEDLILDFDWVLEKRVENALAYAVSYLVSPETKKGLIMTISSDDQAKVYLNGKEVYKHLFERSLNTAADKVENLELERGVNTLVVKILNGTGPWQCAVNFTDAQGNPVKGLRATIDPHPQSAAP